MAEKGREWNKYLDKYYTVIVHTPSYKEPEFMVAALGRPDMYNRIDIENEVKLVFKGVGEVSKYFDTWFDEKLKSLSNKSEEYMVIKSEGYELKLDKNLSFESVFSFFTNIFTTIFLISHCYRPFIFLFFDRKFIF